MNENKVVNPLDEYYFLNQIRLSKEESDRWKELYYEQKQLYYDYKKFIMDAERLSEKTP